MSKKYLDGLTSLEQTLGDTGKDIIVFIKQHKKLLLTAITIYLVCKYLFEEED